MKNILIVLLPMFAIIYAGCGSQDGAPKAHVVVYSPHGPEVLKDYEARFEAANPDVDVQCLDMGSQDVYQRVAAERQRPRADVWWGAPSSMFAQAADEGLLEPYRPTWADAAPANARDAQDLWYGTYRTPLAIMFNNRALTKETAPQTWDALIAPEWKGRVTLRKPGPSGTMRAFLGAMISRQSDEEAGFAWLRKLNDATEAYCESPQFLFDHMKRREDLVTVWLLPDVILQRERNGFPFDCVTPPQTPVLIEAIAIIKGCPNPEPARRFYEFVTSQESLAHQAHAYAKMPVRPDIPPASLPAWMNEVKLDPMPMDWARFAVKEKEWCARWEKETGQGK